MGQSATKKKQKDTLSNNSNQLFKFQNDPKLFATLPLNWHENYTINIRGSNSTAFAELIPIHNFPRHISTYDHHRHRCDWDPKQPHRPDQIDSIVKIVARGAYMVEYFLYVGQSGRFYMQDDYGLYSTSSAADWCGRLLGSWLWIDFPSMVQSYYAADVGRKKQEEDKVEVRDILPTALGVVVVCKDSRVFFMSFKDESIRIMKEFDYRQCGLSVVSRSTMAQSVLLASGGDGPIEVFDIKQAVSRHVPVQYHTPSTPKFMASIHEQCAVMVSRHNEIYVRTQSENYDNHGFGRAPKGDCFNLVRADLDAPIIDLQAGWLHYVVLLSNGKVFAHGYNSLYQCGVPKNGTERWNWSESVTHPIQMILPPQAESSFVTSIWCSSEGTVLRTRSEVIFYGEKVEKRQDALSFDGVENVLLFPLDELVEIDVTPERWCYIIFGKRLRNNQKSLKYFQDNMKKYSSKGMNSFGQDIQLICMA